MTEIIASVNVKSLHIYAIRSQWVNRVVFGHDAPQGVACAAVPKPKLSRHVDVSCGGEDVLLRVDDAEMACCWRLLVCEVEVDRRAVTHITDRQWNRPIC